MRTAVDNPVVDDREADKKKLEGPTPATGHAPLRQDLAQRTFVATKPTAEEQIVVALTDYLNKLDTITGEQFARGGDAYERRTVFQTISNVHPENLSRKMQFIVFLGKKLAEMLSASTTEDFVNGYSDELRNHLRAEIAHLSPQEFGKLFAAGGQRNSNTVAYTVGAERSYDEDLAGGDPALNTKMGRRDDYEGGWVWHTANEAMDAIEKHKNDLMGNKKYAVYELALPNGWDVNVSPQPGPDGIYLLMNDAPIVTKVQFPPAPDLKTASENDEYWLDLVEEREANAKARFMESSDMQQLAIDGKKTMEQAWEEMGADFANTLYDPRNRVVAKAASLAANRPNAEAWNEVESVRANLNYLLTGEHFRNLSDELQAELRGIYAELETVSKDWNGEAGHPPEESSYEEPERGGQRLPE